MLPPKIMKMCEVMMDLADEDSSFTAYQVLERLGAFNSKDRFNVLARFNRLVAIGVARIANEKVAGKELYTVTPAMAPYMVGDRGGFLSALTAHPQPDLCVAWGIGFPAEYHTTRYPNARVHKQSWN